MSSLVYKTLAERVRANFQQISDLEGVENTSIANTTFTMDYLHATLTKLTSFENILADIVFFEGTLKPLYKPYSSPVWVKIAFLAEKFLPVWVDVIHRSEYQDTDALKEYLASNKDFDTQYNLAVGVATGKKLYVESNVKIEAAKANKALNRFQLTDSIEMAKSNYPDEKQEYSNYLRELESDNAVALGRLGTEGIEAVRLYGRSFYFLGRNLDSAVGLFSLDIKNDVNVPVFIGYLERHLNLLTASLTYLLDLNLPLKDSHIGGSVHYHLLLARLTNYKGVVESYLSTIASNPLSDYSNYKVDFPTIQEALTDFTCKLVIFSKWKTPSTMAKTKLMENCIKDMINLVEGLSAYKGQDGLYQLADMEYLVEIDSVLQRYKRLANTKKTVKNVCNFVIVNVIASTTLPAHLNNIVSVFSKVALGEEGWSTSQYTNFTKVTLTDEDLEGRVKPKEDVISMSSIESHNHSELVYFDFVRDLESDGLYALSDILATA